MAISNNDELSETDGDSCSLLGAFGAEVDDLADLAIDSLGLSPLSRTDDDVNFVLAYVGSQIAGAEAEYNAPYDVWIALFDLSTLEVAIRKVRAMLEEEKPVTEKRAQQETKAGAEIYRPTQKSSINIESGPLGGEVK